ncbi:MAG: PIN domain-containing protein [Pirellulales bacterium]|nr:PIN domain-containing protein [Pirellulales bacterium]
MSTARPTDLVLIDTCMWVPYFNRPNSIEKKAIDDLLDEDRAAITGLVLAELLQGFQRNEQADWVASSLRGLHELEPQWDDWRHAAALGRRLAGQGHQLPLTDLVLATIALRVDCAIYTIDPHFDLVSSLRRFAPS